MELYVVLKQIGFRKTRLRFRDEFAGLDEQLLAY
jgi:hypothetical protein